MPQATQLAPKSVPQKTFLRDYQPPSFWVRRMELDFSLDLVATRVRSRLHFERNGEKTGDWTLDGEDVRLRYLSLDGVPLAADRYRLTPTQLHLSALPVRGVLELETEINPAANTRLEGLYRSSGLFCTQCEAEGFRRITYYPDRPDVMASWRVRLSASRADCPVLLSNGNLVGAGDNEDGTHWALWDDPHPKPAYLFALVAGRLDYLESSHTTALGRDICLRIYVEPGDRERCAYAMDVLKRAMRWDEDRFGLNYDLDCFNIVAVSDFNMGAMENKGLNIFNSKYILADAQTATDRDFGFIESIVAHEYFHNWSGNRVTCRDWFQLSLKEGLTVFRDQEFSADMRSAPVQRIDDVKTLRARQFPEDAGPLAHPVRPESYIEINNFYTATVYEKGAEVIRMLQTLLGRAGFDKGVALYFERHDGQAVTCDDWIAAMAQANGVDLSLFKQWYAQAGTPVLTADWVYHPAQSCLELTLRQQTPATPGQDEKVPLQMPVRCALLDATAQTVREEVLLLDKVQKTFRFEGLDAGLVPSLNRGFSVPVKLETNHSVAERLFLMEHDSDPFNRWEATQDCLRLLVLAQLDSGEDEDALSDDFLAAFKAPLHSGDPAFRALLLSLPTVESLADQMVVADYTRLCAGHRSVRTALAQALESDWDRLFHACAVRRAFDPACGEQSGLRALRAVALDYLCLLPVGKPHAAQLFATADNMTERMMALQALRDEDCPERQTMLDDFAARFGDHPLVMDKWFSLQATAQHPRTLDLVEALRQHPAFSWTNPNRVRALIGAFSVNNPLCFHDLSGRGYRLLAEAVLTLNGLNPQVAARLLTPLGTWQRVDEDRQRLMKQELRRILDSDNLSRDVYDVASRALGV